MEKRKKVKVIPITNGKITELHCANCKSILDFKIIGVIEREEQQNAYR